jgi:hypothetical protein
VAAAIDLPLLQTYVVQSLRSGVGSAVLLSDNTTGTGKVKPSTNYLFSIKGTGLYSGSSFTLQGTVGSYTNFTTYGETNVIPLDAPTTANILKGSKFHGQVITGTTTNVTVHMQTGI